MNDTKTPAAAGYRMPAEWTPHRATWLVWPQRKSDWPGKFSPIRWVYTEIIRRLTAHEIVELIVADATIQEQARKCLRTAGVDLARVSFVQVPTNRGWTRDSGPTFVRHTDGTVALVDWHFNAWAKYDDWQLDDQLPAFIAQRDRRPAWQPQVDGQRVVLEGGSIDVNGAGWLLTTEECLLSTVQARNPGLSRGVLEETFGAYLGVTDVIWLNRGIVGDDTHGHVDDLTRFVAERTVVTVVEDNPADENYAPLRENLERLHGWRSRQGGKLDVVPLPMPHPVVFAGQRLPASYANFYIANGVVIVPTFNDPRDRQALGILAELFPDRRVVGIHAGDLVWGLGTLHCMTQQEPA
jgi:agmatine deiminase